MQSETEPFIFPKAKAASGSLSAEERLGWRQFGWGGIGYWAETVENIQDGEGVERLASGPMKRMNLRK